MKVEAWLVVKAKRDPWNQTYPYGHPYHGQVRVEGAKVVKVAQNKPALEDDSIAFKVEIDVDSSWFLEGTATIKAQVPAPPQSAQEIQATVDLPVKGKAPSPAAQIIHASQP